MTKPITVTQLSQIESRVLVPGATVRFVHSDHMTLAYWEFEADTPLPEHAHPHEQVTNIITGTFELTIAGKAHRLEAGHVALIPPDARHSGRAITVCRVIDVFYPVREEYR
jgi:quercetin dioxygenase-like cupin family protein